MLEITPGERKALQLLAQGKGFTEVAGCLGVTASEVGSHLKLLFAKMGASDRAEAIANALRRGLLINS